MGVGSASASGARLRNLQNWRQDKCVSHAIVKAFDVLQEDCEVVQGRDKEQFPDERHEGPVWEVTVRQM